MRFVDEHRHRFGVAPICRALEFAPSTYYGRKTRPPSQRSRDDELLLADIRRVHEANYRAYGARRVWKALEREGIEVGRGRVERLMRTAGLQGAGTPKRRWTRGCPIFCV